MNRCDICLEKTCHCMDKGGCHCDTCAKFKDCPKFLKPTIRITTKCTQSCSHCCFDGSPKNTEMMSVATAESVSRFLVANEIQVATIMGGEFFCNPDWKSIFDLIIPKLLYVRIVSNSDWVVDPTVVPFLKKFPNIKLSLSFDKWHTNENVEQAAAMCKEAGIEHNIETEAEASTESIVPVGRGDMSFGFFSMFGCYCQRPDKKYSFLIDETGAVFKCGFGMWEYATVQEYEGGGFAARFKEFNKEFYSVFIPNCATCSRSYRRTKKTPAQEAAK